MHCITVLFVLLLALSDSRWCAEDIFSLTPVILCKHFQKQARKSLSLSETISSSSPFLQYQFVKNSSANCLAVRVVVVGIMWMSEPRQSVIVRMLL